MMESALLPPGSVPALSLAPAMPRAQAGRSVVRMDAAGEPARNHKAAAPLFLARTLPRARGQPSCNIPLVLMAARSVQLVREDMELAPWIRTALVVSAGTEDAKRIPVLVARAMASSFRPGAADLIFSAICLPSRMLGVHARLAKEEEAVPFARSYIVHLSNR